MTSHLDAQKEHQTTNLGVRSSNLFGCAIISKGKRRMPNRDETSGGTLGAQSPDFFPTLFARLRQIGISAGLDWETAQRQFDAALPAEERISPATIQAMLTSTLKAAVDEAVEAYRSAPPLPPSRLKRDIYDPAIKTASKLSAHLQSEQARSLLASVFKSHDEALNFLNHLDELAAVEQIDDEAAGKQRVEDMLTEFGIQVGDEIEYLRERFGEEAVRIYQSADQELRALERKHRSEPIRFRLACEVIKAVSFPLGIAMNIMQRQDVPRLALVDMVTLFVEAVGTFPGTPKPGEDYLAKAITSEALEFVGAEMRLQELSSHFEI